MSSKISWPCKVCVCGGKCDRKMGCYQWQCWFRAYWAALRRKLV